MKEVSKERLDSLIADLQKMVDEDNLGSIGRIDFCDYSKHLEKLKAMFPQFTFYITSYGIQVDKGETK